MPGYHIYNPRNVPLTDVGIEHIQLGLLVRVPFRYRVQGIFRFRRDDDRIELILRNSLAVPPGAGFMDMFCQRKTTWAELEADLRTDALFVFGSSVDQRAEGIEQLRSGDSSKIEFTPSSIQAHRFLNEFTIAYCAGTGDWIGMLCPRLLATGEFFNAERLFITIICPPGERLSDEEARTALAVTASEGGRTTTHGSLDDLSGSALAMVPVAFAAHRQHVFYEFVVRSRAALEQEEFQVALLLACVAFEAVHAALLHLVMAAPEGAEEKDREELISNLLREQGFHTLFRVTPILFLHPKERPEPQLLDKCKKAVELRNDIMHAKSKRGKYKLRQHSDRELIEAQQAVLKMVSVFEAALRRRIPLAIQG